MKKKTVSKILPKKTSELADLEAKLKRALADYDNLEKRICDQKKDWRELAKIEILDKLLSALDDLERAEDHLANQGLTLALNQLRSVFTSEGVVQIEALDHPFDPEKMDCVGLEKGPANQVVKIVQKGYLLGDRVIRPAKVEVGRGSSQENKLS